MRRVSRLVPLVLAVVLLFSSGPLARGLAQAPPGSGQAQEKEKIQAADAKAKAAQEAQAREAQAKEAQAKAAQEKTQPPADQPEDFKAFNDASKITDPQKRAEALEKFVADYPDSLLVASASSQAFNQLFNSVRDNTKKLLTEIDRSIESSRRSMSAYSSMASRLLMAGILLDEAEALALKGLSAADEKTFIEEMKVPRPATLPTGAADGPATSGGSPAISKGTRTGGFRMSSVGGVMTATWIPPSIERPAATPPATRRERSDDELRADFRSQRTRLLTTLGGIYLKRGKMADAERTLKEVYNSDVAASMKATTARDLATIAKKAGDDKAQVEYLMTCVVLGWQPDARKDLDEAYKRAHGGSLDGLEAILDERYKTTLKHIEVKPFDRPKTGNPRLVLAELFTGAACPPCVGADLAFDAALERFKPQDLSLLVYHEHIPGPDPMTNPSAEARLKFYGVRGVPTFYIDGMTDGAGGGNAESAEPIFTKRLNPVIEKQLAAKPGARVDLKATMTGSTIKVRAAIGRIASKSDKLKLQIALVEEHRTYSGSNGVRFHPMVVRNLASPEMPKEKAEAAGGEPNEAQAGADQAKDAPAAAPVGTGFPVSATRGAKVEYVFDVAKIAAENKKTIDEFLTRPFRGGANPTFAEREDDIDTARLLVVAFVQDEATKKILQAASVKLAPTK